MTRRAWDTTTDLLVLAGVAAGAVAATPLLPSSLRVVLLVAVVLLVPGAACARAAGVRAPVAFLTVTVGASPAVLLVLSMASLLAGGLRPRAVLIADLVVAVLLLAAARARRRS